MDVARTMDAAELARWTRFAGKGGIGRCTAIGDCVAEAAQDLMFLKNDEIVVLMQLPEENLFLGYCEGIVGRFHANDVHFHSKLKKPVMTKRSSVSGASSTGKSTPTPSMAQSPTPFSRSGAQYNNSPSPQSQLRYQPPPSPPLTPSSSHERIPQSTSFSSTTVSLSNSISSIPDAPATVQSSPEPIGVRLKPLDTSTSTASVDTTVSGRSSTYMASSISSVSGLDSEDGSTEAGRNRRSETTMVEMWPSSSPSSALARKPVNGSRLALAMQPPTDSEESDEEEMTNGLGHGIGGSDEEYDPDDGGWATHGGTLPLQVVKINTPNSMPPSPYQAFPSSSPRVQSDSDSDVFQSRSGSVTQTDSSRLHDETDSDSEYNTTDPEEEMTEDHDDETTKFAVPSERQSISPTPNHGTTNHHPATSISGSVGSQTFARASSSSHNGSMLYGDTSHSLMHEESTRLSIAAPSFQGSEDGEVGIGLSLLQGLLGGDDEGSDSDSDSDSDQDQDLDQDQDETPSADVAPEQEQDGSSSRRQSVISAVRGPPPPGEDWDTASDIYEDYYRFSRFSTNPRSSTSTFASSHKMPARFSQSSHRGIPGPSTTVVPPVPTDSRGEAESHRGPKTRSIDSDASVYTQASKSSFIDPSRLSAQPLQSRRPTPLELIGVNGEPSPLLHTRWGSPLSSPSPPPSSSATQSSFIDAGTPPASASSGSISPGGAASVLRQQLENDRGSPIGSYTNMEAQNGPAHEGLGSRIVIEDDEEPPVPTITDEPRSLSPEDEPEAETDDDSRRRPGFEDLAPLVINNTLSPPPDPTASTSPQSPSTATPFSPSSPPDLPPPPSQTPQQSQQSQHQSRPSLSELRGYAGHDSSSNGVPLDKSRQRTSVFLPHPNAPKPPPPTGAAEGPLYIRAAPPPSQQRSENVVNIIKMSIGRSTVTRVMPTIYGRTDVDLASATGPVRVVFSIDPLPPLSIPLPSQIPFRNGAAPVPRRKLTESDPGHVGQSGSPGPPRAPAPPGRSLSATASPVSAVPSKSSPLAEKPAPASVAIPRPNFFPKAGTSRPRSRSFSGFNTGREISAPISREEGVKVHKGGRSESMSTVVTPASPSISPSPNTSSSSPSPPPLGKHASRSSLRSAHAPSPLSLPHNNSLLGSTRPALRSPTSPLGFPSAPANSAASAPSRSPHQLRQVPSRSTLNEPASRTPLSRAAVSADSPISPAHTRNDSLLSSSHDRPSLDSDSLRVVSPTPGGRESLRQKLSLPNLRRNQSRQSLGSGSGDNETVQVKDMDFELIRPNLAQFQQASGRSSEDSSFGAREASVDGRTSNVGDTFRRTDSPAMSVASNQTPWSSSSDTSIDAHRQRELKWVSIMGAVPPAQATKNKKVKKLLMDGSVPSSVRFLVWSHLTDGKAKAIPGVYAQLGKRARVPALADIERDVQRCSSDHPQMQTNHASIMGLLQAYLTMVPDIAYSKGLPLITGHLLALSPEEDAFWIFVSIMDSYLRPYFSTNTTQIEVDAALFGRALEANDAQVAKKVLLDMSVNPVDICRPWFSTLFVDTLPPDYLNRVWDLFLFEGIPFLFRVGLAMFYCCRRRVLEATNHVSLLEILNHPSPNWLPPSPDAFIALANSFKVKDDDVRKQRIKMEAQVKRQTQAPRPNPAASRSLSFPRP